jgi:hypothetical protein
MVTDMTTDRETLLELIRKQPPMNSEQFWQQVEKARVLSPNLEPSTLGQIKPVEESLQTTT